MTTSPARPARPIALSVLPERIPAALATRDRWMLWRLEARDPGWSKVPYRTDGRGKASATDPATWAPFDAAVRAYRSGSFDGLGFALGDGVVGIDHDHAYDPSDSTITEAAARWQALGAYRELSPSGSGIHDLVMGDLPDDPHRQGWGRRKGALEVYGGERYLTVTGRPLPGSPVDVPIVDPDCFARLYHEIFIPPSSNAGRSSPPPSPVRQDDREILVLAGRARNSDRFESLWRGDTSAHGGDDSAADLALVSLLAFYTQDADQIDRLFRGSGLMRPKWDRPDYRARTIERAMQRSEFYQASGRVLNMPGNRNRASHDSADWGESGESGDETTGPTPSGKDRDEQATGKRSQATQLVEIVESKGVSLWHTPDLDPYISLTVDDHIEHHRIGSTAVRDMMARWYWLDERKVIGSQATQDAVNALAGQARFEGPVHELANRIAHHEGAIWVDLGTDDWSALQITTAGYRVVPSPDVPLRFRRTRFTAPLPEPVSGGRLEDIRQVFALDDDTFMLVTGWLIGCFQRDGGRALLEILGQQGSGKSTLARMLISLVDPVEVPLRSLPRDEIALAIASIGRVLLGIDNVSGFAPDMSDAICRSSTGAGTGQRKLYSDTDEVTIRVKLSLLWTGITPSTVSRPDLADRTISISLESLGDDQYQSERDLWSAFDAMRPRLFGALCDAVVVALRRQGTFTLARRPRLADFAEFVEAAAPAFGWAEGAFVDVLDVSRATANVLAVEASPIGPLVADFAAQLTRPWEGTATDLLAKLRDRADDETRRSPRFPKQANHLSNALRRLEPALRSSGISLTFARTRKGSSIRLEVAPSASPPQADYADRTVF